MIQGLMLISKKFIMQSISIYFFYIRSTQQVMETPERSEGGCQRYGVMPPFHPSVTSSSFYTFGDRKLKFGMHITHMDGSKVTNQIFDILSRSGDIQV